MLGEAIRYPWQGEDRLRNVAIGGLCILFSFLLIPALFLLGYQLRVLRQSPGETEPPAFDDWGDLLVDGLKAFVVQFVYSLVPAVLSFFVVGAVGVAVFSAGSAAGTDSAAAGAAAAGSLVVLALLGLLVLVALAVGYVLPAALTMLAREDSITAAFSWSRLRPVLFSGEYLVGVVLYVVVLLVGQVVGGALVIVFLLGLFVIFYVQVAGFYLIGRSVDRALAEGR